MRRGFREVRIKEVREEKKKPRLDPIVEAMKQYNYTHEDYLEAQIQWYNFFSQKIPEDNQELIRYINETNRINNDMNL